MRGRAEARYARPCAIVMARRRAEGGDLVMVAATTHAAPLEGQRALEIPSAVKRHLGLDSERSWIVVDEVNEFLWPGFDLRLNARGEIVYGVLPNKLLLRVRDALLTAISAGALRRTQR